MTYGELLSIHVSLFGDTFTAGYRPALFVKDFRIHLNRFPGALNGYPERYRGFVFCDVRGSDICSPDRDMCFPGYQYVYISVDAGPGIPSG